jgi:hypothetical protein
MAPKSLAQVVADQFKVKVNDVAFKGEKKQLDDYLEKTGRNMDDVVRIVANHLTLHPDLFKI